MKTTARVAVSALAMTAGLGLAGLAAAGDAQAYPGPFPAYHWCPGQQWDPAWGNNWDQGRCHDNDYLDGEPHDAGHWHGQGPWHPDGPGGPGGPGGQQWQNGQGQNWQH